MEDESRTAVRSDRVHGDADRRRTRYTIYLGTLSIVSSALSVLLGVDAARALIWSTIQRWVHPLLAEYWGRLATEAAFIFFALTLFRLRQRHQRAYGALEVAFAVVTSWVVLDAAETNMTVDEAVGLIAAGYILVRGLANYSEGTARLVRAVQNQ